MFFFLYSLLKKKFSKNAFTRDSTCSSVAYCFNISIITGYLTLANATIRNIY